MKDFIFKTKDGEKYSFKGELRYELACMNLVCCTESLLAEIALPETTQPQLALTYALAIKSKEDKDWLKINEAIMEKWSRSGLMRVKHLAWIGFEKDFWKKDKNFLRDTIQKTEPLPRILEKIEALENTRRRRNE